MNLLAVPSQKTGGHLAWAHNLDHSSPAALWWGRVLRLQKRLVGTGEGNRNTGRRGNLLAIMSVVVLIIVFVVWRLILLLR